MTIEQIRNQLAEYFFRKNPTPWVNGIGIGLLETGGNVQKVQKEDASKQVWLFVAPSTPKCELDGIKTIVNKQTNNQARLFFASRFVGLSAKSGDAISPFAPALDNLPPVSASTLPGVVQAQGKRYILGCNHALAHNRRALSGAVVVAPSTRDSVANLAIGSVTHVVELNAPEWPLKGTP